MHNNDLLIDVYIKGTGGTPQSNYLGTFRVPNADNKLNANVYCAILNGLTYNGNTLNQLFVPSIKKL